jgi:predicted membrane metal-binding protein
VALWKYALAAFGCMLADYFGDHGMAVPAVATFVALAVFSIAMLKPFQVGDRES